MSNLDLRAAPTASRRTRNRAYEHQLRLDLTRLIDNGPNRNVPGLEGKPCVLTFCANCEWQGWLPHDELED